MNRRVPRTCVRSWIGFACTHETRRPSPNTWLKAPMRKLMAFLPKCNVFSFLPSVNFHEYENYLDFSCRYIPAVRFYPWLCSSNYSFDLDKTDSEIYKLYLWKKYEIILKKNFRSFSQRLVLSFPLRQSHSRQFFNKQGEMARSAKFEPVLLTGSSNSFEKRRYIAWKLCPSSEVAESVYFVHIITVLNCWWFKNEN